VPFGLTAAAAGGAPQASAAGNEPLTWRMNALLPAQVSPLPALPHAQHVPRPEPPPSTRAPQVVDRWRAARIVYVSSGNVYPFSAADGPGSAEADPVGLRGLPRPCHSPVPAPALSREPFGSGFIPIPGATPAQNILIS
jgi:hypothetical protein